jgi:hypothetical protein
MPCHILVSYEISASSYTNVKEVKGNKFKKLGKI